MIDLGLGTLVSIVAIKLLIAPPACPVDHYTIADFAMVIWVGFAFLAFNAMLIKWARELWSHWC